MGIHTSIYRERSFCYGDTQKYEIKLFKGKKEIKLSNAVSLREEFYFGKSAWAINEWLYKYVCKNNHDDLNEDFSYEYIYDERIYLKDLKKLLKTVELVLSDHSKANKILPMPKDLELTRPKERCFDAKTNSYIVRSTDDWEPVPRKEMYNDYYFKILENAKKLLQQLIDEDGADLVDEYIIEVV